MHGPLVHYRARLFVLPEVRVREKLDAVSTFDVNCDGIDPDVPATCNDLFLQLDVVVDVGVLE